MKNKRVFWVIAVLLLLTVVLFYVERRRKGDEKIPLWSMVPESAALVYETAELPSNWEKLSNSALWKNLHTIDGFQEVEERMLLLDSLANTRQFFADKQLLIGTHVISKDDFDFTFFFRINNTQERNALTQALRRFQDKESIKQESRMFNGFRISELIDRSNNKHFSYLIHKDIFVGSFTPFLIEDVVRNIETEFQEYSFQYHNAEMEEVPSLANDEGNLYLNVAKLPLLLSMFTTNELLPYLQPLGQLGSTIFLDVNMADGQLLFNGFSKTEKGAQDTETPQNQQSPVWLSTFEEEEPQSINLYQYVPERTAVLYHFGTQGGVQWLQKLYQQQERSDEKLVKQSQRYRKNLSELYNVRMQDQLAWFQGEVGLMVLESIDARAPDKVLLMEASDTSMAAQNLKQLESKLSRELEGVSYSERFAGYQIGEISFKEFPAAVLGPVALGFEQCFYMITDRYVIFANSIRALKRLISDREAENTWDKSIQEVRFLETTLKEANVSVFVNTARCWELLEEHLAPKWKKFSSTHAHILKNFDHLALQFSKSDKDFYTSLAVNFEPVSDTEIRNEQFRDVSRLFVDYPLQTKPYVVRDHTDQTLEVLFQDEKNQLYLAEPDGEVLWKDSLTHAIIGEVYQIDYFKNGKLQYLFSSDSAIHLIDRTGTAVSGYPFYMPEGVRIQNLSLLDYDNSKNYRFLVSDTEGKLWMFNKDREGLEGWSPNATINNTLATPPFHVRVGNKDFIIAIEQDGSIYSLNRRGQPYAGFPINLDKQIKSLAYTELGSNPANTVLSTVSLHGEIVSFNLQGNITRREQLYRPSSQTRFQLSIDALGKTFIIARQDERLFGVLDRDGKLLFEKNYMSPAAMTSDMLEVQYYDFGAGNEIYAVTDKVQEFTYLFNRQGTLIKDRPIESKFPVGILFYDNDKVFQIYRNFENEFSVLSFSP